MTSVGVGRSKMAFRCLRRQVRAFGLLGDTYNQILEEVLLNL